MRDSGLLLCRTIPNENLKGIVKHVILSKQEVVRMVKQVTAFLDRMATIIRLLNERGELWEEKDFQSVFENPENAYYMRMKSFPALLKENGRCAKVSVKELTEGFFHKLDKFIQDYADNTLQLLLLVYFMDRSIVHCYESVTNVDEDIEEFEAVNGNVRETGIILLKKVKCSWRVRETGDDLNHLLEYFYYIDLAEIQGAVVKNYILDPNIILKAGKENLRIAISPVTKNMTIRINKIPYEKNNRNTGERQLFFRVEEILEVEAVKQLIQDNIREAGQNNADILVFPEMLGTREMLQELLECFEEEECPPLIVFPSIWERTENDENNTNSSCMILNGEGVIFEQKKRYCFSKEENGKRIYEDINVVDHNVIHLLHIEGLGRICIVICYDYLHEQNRRMILEKLKPNLIISPSFSTGSFHFVLVKEEGFSKGCNWVWCNTCSAAHVSGKDDNFEVVGIVTKLSKNCDLTDPEAMENRFEGKRLCKKESCEKCVFFTDISLRLKSA